MNASTVGSRSRLVARLAVLTAAVALLSGVTTAATGTFTAETTLPGPARAGTLELPPVAADSASATRMGDGRVVVDWQSPGARSDVPTEYTISRSVGESEAVSVQVGDSVGFTDDLRIDAALRARHVTDVSAGTAHSCAVADGRAYCWGRGAEGQLGNGGTADSDVPVAVDMNGALAGRTVTAISAGQYHSCAIAEDVSGDSRAYCWGRGLDGQLGTQFPASSLLPAAVHTGDHPDLAGNVTRITAGFAHSCAVASGNAYCWGRGNNGVLGNGASTTSATPVKVAFSPVREHTVIEISAGLSHTCATAGPVAFCWGSSVDGQLGDCCTAVSNVPVRIDALIRMAVTKISAGNRHTCAVADGTAYCWGFGGQGRLGDGDTGNHATPVEVDFDVQLPDSSATVVDIDAGGSHSCAVTTGEPNGGNTYCWGNGWWGRLGDIANDQGLDSALPLLVTGGRNATAVSAGSVHSCAIIAAAVECWGRSDYGQLGIHAPNKPLDLDTPYPIDTSGALAPTPYCEAGWVRVAGERCAPDPEVPVRYTIDYTKAGWSPSRATIVSAE